MDLIKMVGEIADGPTICMPTIPATCAAYTPLSVVYTPEGCCRGAWYHRCEAACAVCDLDFLCRQPARYGRRCPGRHD